MKILGYNSNNSRLNILYSLAYSDFYFYEKRVDAFVKINNYYYFTLEHKKYTLRIEILLKTNAWAFVIFNLGDKHLEDIILKIEKYYSSNEWEKIFDSFPVIIIISNNINRDNLIIDSTKTKETLISVSYTHLLQLLPFVLFFLCFYLTKLFYISQLLFSFL